MAALQSAPATAAAALLVLVVVTLTLVIATRRSDALNNMQQHNDRDQKDEQREVRDYAAQQEELRRMYSSNKRSDGKEAVLVTGGAGFIGSHVVEALLQKGQAVVVVDNLNDAYDVARKRANLSLLKRTADKLRGSFTFVYGDITDEAAMRSVFRQHRIGKVCHLAARAGVRPSIRQPALYAHNNVEGTVVMLQVARSFHVPRFVYASSSSVYGINTKVPFAESDPVNHPQSPYAATKRSCEMMAESFSQLYNMTCTGLRFFTVYGPRGRPDMAPYKFVDRISRGLSIDVYGNGTTSRDYTFVDDVVAGVLSALDRAGSGHEIVNLGNSQTVPLRQLIAVIEDTVKRKAIKHQMPDQPGDVPFTNADISKATALFGYKPTTSIQDGIARLVQWYRTDIQGDKGR